LIGGALSIEVRGEVVTSNAGEFRELVRAALGRIHRAPTTDEEFGQAELDVRALSDAEKAVRAAKEKALADASDLHALFSALDETSDEIRQARLELEKQIKLRKEEVRADYIAGAIEKIPGVDAIVARRAYTGELEAALKGKRTLSSIAKALDVAVKIIAGRLAKSRDVLDQFESAHGVEMVMDRADLELRSADHVEAELRRRLESKAAKEEADRLRADAAKANAQAAAARAESHKGTIPAGPIPLPAPPKIGSLPTGPSPLAEWSAFSVAVVAAFHPLREAKAKLRHQANHDKAQEFAAAVNAAWLLVKGGAE
jgi:hypothetical protein